MSRMSDILNRLELAAKRLGMSIEDTVLILEGKHPTHHIAATVTMEVQMVSHANAPSSEDRGAGEMGEVVTKLQIHTAGEIALMPNITPENLPAEHHAPQEEQSAHLLGHEDDGHMDW